MVKMKLKPCQHTNAEEHETGNSKAARYVSASKVSRHEVKYQLSEHKSMVIQIYNSIYISEHGQRNTWPLRKVVKYICIIGNTDRKTLFVSQNECKRFKFMSQD